MPFDPGVLDVPTIDEAFKSQDLKRPWNVLVKRSNKTGRISYPFNPLDAVAWKGDLYPVRLNIDDFMPIASHRVGLPPSAGTTFLTDNFVVCSFPPRAPVTDPKAAKLPVFHSNDDYEELVFLHKGTMTHRSKFQKEGALSFHPMALYTDRIPRRCICGTRSGRRSGRVRFS